jgi:hypothetical protein
LIVPPALHFSASFALLKMGAASSAATRIAGYAAPDEVSD